MSAAENPTPDLRSERTRVRLMPERGHYDRATVNEILDRGIICHVGVTLEDQPFVIPTLHVRLGSTLYLHGSPGSRILRAALQGASLCITVTLVDGLVLARSALHHSMNYRSVVVLGKAFAVEDLEERRRVLRAMSEHLIPGRWEEVREPTLRELKRTLVVGIPITEASAKVRSGPPVDDEADYELPVWAGVLPLGLRSSEPVADPRLAVGITPPDYVVQYGGPAPASEDYPDDHGHEKPE